LVGVQREKINPRELKVDATACEIEKPALFWTVLMKTLLDDNLLSPRRSLLPIKNEQRRRGERESSEKAI